MEVEERCSTDTNTSHLEIVISEKENFKVIDDASFLDNFKFCASTSPSVPEIK